MSQSQTTQPVARRRNRKTRLAMVFGGLLVVIVCVSIRLLTGTDTAQADGPRPTAASPTRSDTPAATTATRSPTAPSAASQNKVMAQVNGVQITRDELADDCFRHYGKEVVESMVNKYLISEECKRRNIVVTRAEVDGEIERMAQRFSLPVEQWLKMLKQERGIKPVQYASDIIWPTLALRKLAGDRLKVSQADVDAAFEMHYGESVRCRLIAMRDKAKAEDIRAKAAAAPDQFGDLAKKFSEDSSASVKGVIPPIRRHGGYVEIEKAAFGMEDGQVSPVLAVGEQHIILKREARLPASKVDRKIVGPQLEEVVREKKMRTVSADIFQQLQQASRVDLVMNDPAKRKAMPGVAATINGSAISVREVADQCLDRHGEEILEGLINRRLIELECKRRNISISDKELDAEIARTAAEMVPLKADRTPDVEGWLKTVTEQQHCTVEVYRNDAVWPTVALKKLVGDDIKITQEELDKGFQANFGPRVRCRAIVVNNLRRAQEVWELARRKPTVENFGNLAEAYSIEPGSQALRGEVPPIQRHGGQPLLEQAAFALKPGDLSEIIQVGDKWVILLCEGYTKPIDVDQARVQPEIERDLFEKRQRIAMNDCFETLQNGATVDNYLAGTSTSPQQKRAAAEVAKKAGAPAGKQPAGAQRPATTANRQTMPLKLR